MKLVPLDLVRHQRRDHVVQVGGRGDRDGQRRGAVPVPLAPPARRRDAPPAPRCRRRWRGEICSGSWPSTTRSTAAMQDGSRCDGVDEGAGIGLVRVGARVEARPDPLVGRLEGAHRHVARRAQDRGVGPDVQVDGVAADDLVGLDRASRPADPPLGRRRRAWTDLRALLVRQPHPHSSASRMPPQPPYQGQLSPHGPASHASQRARTRAGRGSYARARGPVLVMRGLG